MQDKYLITQSQANMGSTYISLRYLKMCFTRSKLVAWQLKNCVQRPNKHNFVSLPKLCNYFTIAIIWKILCIYSILYNIWCGLCSQSRRAIYAEPASKTISKSQKQIWVSHDIFPPDPCACILKKYDIFNTNMSFPNYCFEFF